MTSAKDHEDALLRKHLPVFCLHPEEEYLPSDIETFLRESTLRKNGRTYREYGTVTPQVLDALDIKEELSLRSRELVWSGSLPTARIYGVCTRRRREYLLQYILFFAYNGPYTCGCCCCFNVHGHPADFEHVTVVVDRESTEVREVRFGQHGREAVYSWGDVTTSTFRPKVFVAKNNHAFYPDRKKYRRRCCLRNDTTFDDIEGSTFSGVSLETIPLEIVSEETPWLRFTGSWGSSGTCCYKSETYGPMQSRWWRRTTRTTNCFWRFLCC